MRFNFEIFKKWTFRILSTAMVVIWMVIIYSYSAQPADESSDLSGHVSYEIVTEVSNIFHLEWDEDTLQSKAEAIEYPVRKAAHMTEYAILGAFSFVMLTMYGMPYAKGEKGTKLHYLLATSITFLYACTDEYHQTFVPGRAGRFSDVCIDTSGTIIFLLLLMLVLHLKEKKVETRDV